MRIGLIARADNRGLGLQTYEFAHHMRPDRTLVIDPGELSPFDQHFDRFPGARVEPWDGGRISDEAIDWFLGGCDVYYTAETPYDMRLFTEGRERGVRSVLHANPEFWRYNGPGGDDLPRPDVVWCPTTWREETIRLPHTVVPAPVDRERLPFRLREQADTFLHIAGHRAANDRAGTQLVLAATRHVRTRCRLIVYSQDQIHIPASSRMKIEARIGDVPDYWDMYSEGDVFISPRRYGGLSLPIQEAMSCGMPVISIDVEPQRRWLPKETLVNRVPHRRFNTQGGLVDCATASIAEIAKLIDDLAQSPDLVRKCSLASDAYASSISWQTWEPRYRELLGAP